MIVGYGMPRTGGQSLNGALFLTGYNMHIWDNELRYLVDEVDDARTAVVEVRQPIVDVLAKWPNTRFIYTYRDTDDWLRSLDRTAARHATHPNPIWRMSNEERIAAKEKREAALPADTLWLNICDDPGHENWSKLCKFLDCKRPLGPFPYRDKHTVPTTSLSFDERPPGYMRDKELEWLTKQAAKRLRIIEIGVFRGRSASALCEKTNGIVVGVDHFRGSGVLATTSYNEDVESQARNNLSKYIDGGRFKLIVGDSHDEATVKKVRKELGGEADMLFIDGDHSYKGVLRDIELFSPLVSPGGLICGHDINEGGVRSAVKEVFPKWKNAVDSIWCIIN